MNRPSGRRSGSSQGSRSAGRRTDDRRDQPSRPSFSRSRDSDQPSGDRRGGGRFDSGNSSRPPGGGGGFNKDRFASRGADDRRPDARGDRNERPERGGFGRGRDDRGTGRSFENRDDRRGGDDRGARGGFGGGNRFGDRSRPGQGDDRGSSTRFERGDRPAREGDAPSGQRNQKASDRYPRNNDRNRFGGDQRPDRPVRRDDDRRGGDFRGGSERPNRPYGGGDRDRGPRSFERGDRPAYGDRPSRGYGQDRNDRGPRNSENREQRDDRGPRGYGNREFGNRDQRNDRGGDERPPRFNREEGGRPDRQFESRPFEARKKDRGPDRPNRSVKRNTEGEQSPNRDTFTGGGRDSFAENATRRTYSRMRQNEERMKRNGEEAPKEGELPETLEEQEMRLNRYIAASGLCSRREADNLIAQGSISVNGKVITEMGHRVEPGDKVEYGGKLLRPEKFVYVLMNKPKDYITTKEDEEGRRTVMDLLEGKVRERIYPVGRLDRNTTGLLLFTNDGEMAERLMHPSFEIKKIYQADLDRPLSPGDFEAIKKGVVLEDGPAKVDDLAVLSPDRKSVGLEIHIGRNRIVRRIFEHLGYNVVRLDRVMYGGLTKKDLARGKWRFLTPQEIMNLKYYA